MATTTKRQRPEPLPAAERAAVLARYEIKGVKGFVASDGYAFTGTIHRDGKKFLTVEQNGNGGPNTYRPVSKGGYKTRRADIEQLRADAAAWYIGSDDEAEMAEALGVPVEEVGLSEVEDLFVSALLDAFELRKWLVAQTRGGKTVLFQADGDIGGENWKLFKRVRPEHIQKAVEGAKKAGKRVRVVYRAGKGFKELRDEVFEA